MDKIRVKSGSRLEGTITISGAKNSALKLMCATLLTQDPVTLHNVPQLADIATLADLLTDMGTKIELDGDASAKQPYGRVIKFTTPEINPHADYELVRKLRASIGVLGPVLARNHYAEVSLPGGCAIGARPLDLHIMAMEALGAEVTIENGYITAKAEGGLKGGTIVFPKVTVMGTENAMMAATLAKGETIISNAAREPEVADLANMLNSMGAKISGQGTDTITIQGVEKLSGTEYHVIPDRIEAGTYAVAAAITGGDLFLEHANRAHFEATAVKMEEAGVTLEQKEGGLRVYRDPSTPIKAIDIITAPFPGFATDLQAQNMIMMCLADGAGTLEETVFENRFMHVPELSRMGADIAIHGNTATVKGIQKFKGAPVMATDLRASVSLILAGLVAEGETVVSRIYHLDRGYEQLEQKLSRVGAKIERFSDD